jgi:hypothetical protein
MSRDRFLTYLRNDHENRHLWLKNAENLKGFILEYAEILKETNPVYAENLSTY